MTAQFRGGLIGSAFAHGVLAFAGALILSRLPVPAVDPAPVPVEIQENTPPEPAAAFSSLPEVAKVEPRDALVEPRDAGIVHVPAEKPAPPPVVRKAGNRGRFSPARASKPASVSRSTAIPAPAAHTEAVSSASPAAPAAPSGITARTAPAVPVPAGAPVARKAPAIGPDYLARLTRVISAHRSYPRASLASEEEGVVKVRIFLDQAGNLTGSALMASSGFARLDSAAIETLKKIGKFPVPSGNDGAFSVLVPIEHRIKP